MTRILYKGADGEQELLTNANTFIAIRENVVEVWRGHYWKKIPFERLFGVSVFVADDDYTE